MKLKNILTEMTADEIKAFMSKELAKDKEMGGNNPRQVRRGKPIPKSDDVPPPASREDAARFEPLNNRFNTMVQFRTMLHILKDKGQKSKQKSRGMEYDPEDSYNKFPDGDVVYSDMIKVGLLNKRGGIEPLAIEYLNYTISGNIGNDHDAGSAGKSLNSPSIAAAPSRYTPDHADKLTSRGMQGNFPRGVNAKLSKMDSDSYFGDKSRGTHGNARRTLIQKVEETLRLIRNRISDKSRPR